VATAHSLCRNVGRQTVASLSACTLIRVPDYPNPMLPVKLGIPCYRFAFAGSYGIIALALKTDETKGEHIATQVWLSS